MAFLLDSFIILISIAIFSSNHDKLTHFNKLCFFISIDLCSTRRSRHLGSSMTLTKRQTNLASYYKPNWNKFETKIENKVDNCSLYSFVHWILSQKANCIAFLKTHTHDSYTVRKWTDKNTIYIGGLQFHFIAPR